MEVVKLTDMIIPMNSILLLGGSGFLGLNWIRYSPGAFITPTFNTSIPKIGENWQKFSFTGENVEELQELITRVKPQIILNCAALTSIEVCEINETKAHILNYELPKNLAVVSKALGIKLIHISTDHFASEHLTPRSEFENMIPVNVYGDSKLKAEQIISRINPEALIVRVNFFGFGVTKKSNLLDEIILKLSLGENFYGFTDVQFNPISIEQVVVGVNMLIKLGASGLINLAGNEIVSKFDFTQIVSEVFDLDKSLVKPHSSSGHQTGVRRVNYLPLDNTKFTNLTGHKFPTLRGMLDQLKEDTIWHRVD